jgi:hypothetical protein
MAGDKRNPGDASDRGTRQHDGERELEQELARESNEGGDVIGDMRENRHLSGSSTWETLPQPPESSNDPGLRGETF